MQRVISRSSLPYLGHRFERQVVTCVACSLPHPRAFPGAVGSRTCGVKTHMWHMSDTHMTDTHMIDTHRTDTHGAHVFEAPAATRADTVAPQQRRRRSVLPSSANSSTNVHHTTPCLVHQLYCYIVRRDRGRIETLCGGGGTGTTDGRIGLKINTTASISN